MKWQNLGLCASQFLFELAHQADYSVQFQFHSQDPPPKSQTGDFRFLFLLAFLKTRAFGLEPKPVPAPKKFPSPRMTKGEQFCSQQLQLISVPFISMKLICCSSCLATFNRCSTPNRIVPLTSAEKYFCGSKQFLIHQFRKKMQEIVLTKWKFLNSDNIQNLMKTTQC